MVMLKMNRLKKLIFYLFSFSMLFNYNALSKSLPPGSGAGDVKANILILLDTSESMVNKPFGGAAIYEPGDIILLDDGNVLVGQAYTGGIVKFDYDTEDFDTSFVDPDDDGIGDRVFQGKNSMKSCELESGNGNQDSRVKFVMDMAKSKNVKGTTPANKEVIYAASYSYHSVVAIDADGGCVEVIDRKELGDVSDLSTFDEMRPFGLAIRTIDSNDYLVVLGENVNCVRVDEKFVGKGKKKKKKKFCGENDDKPFFYSKNLTTGVADKCDLDKVTASFRNKIIDLRSITMDGGNNLFHIIEDEIYKYPIEKKDGIICPADNGTHTRYKINSGGNNYYRPVKIEIDPDNTSVMYSTSQTQHLLQKLSINSDPDEISRIETIGQYDTSASNTSNTFFNHPLALHVSSDRVWVGSRKTSIQEFDISGASMTWVDELGTTILSRADGAKAAIKAIMNDSSLTSGAYFGYGYWNSGTAVNKKGAKGKWVPFGEKACHQDCPVPRPKKDFYRCGDQCDYYRGWTKGQHPFGRSVQCDGNSCLKVGVGPNTGGRIIKAVDNMELRFGTDGTAFSQLAYDYYLDGNVGLVGEDKPLCQLNYVIVISDGIWFSHDRAMKQILALRNETAAMGVNPDANGTPKGVKTIFMAYGGGIKDPGPEQFQEAAKAGSCDDPNFGTPQQSDPECRQYIIADTPRDLVTKLKSEIERIIASRLSFSAPSITASIQEGGDLYQGQFEYVKGGEWVGHLIRSEVSSDGIVNMQHSDNWDAAKKVKEQAERNQRKIWTVLSGEGLDYKPGYNNFIADNSGSINSLFGILGMQVIDYHNASTPCTGQNGNVDDVKGLINFVRGEDYFVYSGDCKDKDNGAIRDSVFGDIYHSNIVEVGPPSANTLYTSTNQEAYFRAKNGYRTWANSNSNRARTLYVGANDGMLHAIDAETGAERWAFIPPFIAGKLPSIVNDSLRGIAGTKKGGTNAIFGVDGSPVVHDMYISGIKPDGSFEKGTKSWHTILMIPYGRGGAGYSILDITDPLKPLHVFSVYNDFVNSKVMIAKANGKIINSPSNPNPDLDYSGGTLTINDSEEAAMAQQNIEQARNTDKAAEAADESDDEIYTARDAIRTCVSDANFSSTGTNACYKGRVLNFNYTMPEEFIDSPETLEAFKFVDGEDKKLTVTSVSQEASLVTITFGEDVTINKGEGDNKEDDETTIVKINVPNLGTARQEYDYSLLGETWATPRIFRLPVGDTIDNDKYVAVLPAGFGKLGKVGSAVYIIDLESMNEQEGNLLPGKIAEGGAGLIELVDINNQFTDIDGDNHFDIPNSVLGDPVLITPDTFRGARWRGGMVYVNDYEGKITKINLTNEISSGGQNPVAIDLFDHTTLFSLNTNDENGRYSFFGLDAAYGTDTKNLYLFGSTGDFSDIGRRSKGMDNILYGIRDFDFPNFRPVNSGAIGTVIEALNARKIDQDDGYRLNPLCVNTADETMDQGDCPAITKDAWVFKLDKPFDKSQDKPLVDKGQSQLTENFYQKASASPTVYKGTVYYPVYKPPLGSSCAVGDAYVCAADDECGINTSETIDSAKKTMASDSGFDESTGCYYLQPGVLSKLVVFADKLFANVTTSSDEQKDTLISLLSNEGQIGVNRGSWRENY
tara:strand:- start:2461 stop:7365 length:4905 start_codon:yes stop_codon:yes gene_type:complete